MDLQSVKASVKTWEKAFKAKHGTNPTKDDIKNDLNGIADQYALYRKLSKLVPSASSSASSQRLAASSSSSIPSLARSDRTPRHIPSSDYPTTPTPPPRRSNSNSTYPITNGESSQTLKRIASNAALAPRSPSSPPRPNLTRPHFITPVKPRAYSGPVVDPNPLNPFSTTPTRDSSTTKLDTTVESPFIHASSPRKFKEVLAANSLRKVRDRLDGEGSNKEITPRTRARKRLKGEEVEDTPMKDKVVRKSRGAGSGGVNLVKGKGKAMMMEEDHLHEEEEIEEDEFGPSPMKPVIGTRRSFTQLITETDVRESNLGKPSGVKKKEGRQRDIMTMFGKMGSKVERDKGKGKADGSNTSVQAHKATSIAVSQTGSIHHTAYTIVDEPISDPLVLPIITMSHPRTPSPTNHDRLPTPPPDPEIDHFASQPTPDRSHPAEKVLTFSDDEEADEWDPEGGGAKKQLYITGTRRAVKVRGNSSDDDPDEVGYENHEDEQEVTPTLGDGTSATSPTELDSPHSSLAAPLLSLLSLRSPVAKRSTKLDDLRVRAIFNPTDAVKLRAIKRGQDISEQQDEGDEIIPDGAVEEDEGEGDDDWEEECSGWKRTGLGMDDDEEDW